MEEVDKILLREGGLSAHPDDRGGITKFGITKPTLEWWRNAPVTDEDIKNLTKDEAKAIFEAMYIRKPGFDKLPDGVLKSNLIDFGVMSGPPLAIMNLQELLGVDVDGILGPQTLLALSRANHAALNVLLVKKRILMLGRICVKRPSQLAFLNGWLVRVLAFLDKELR